jgi:hypothetical protein
MTKTRWIGAALAAAIALTTGPLTAIAEDWPDHDQKMEKWTTEQFSDKLGELRGSFGRNTDLDAVIVHESKIDTGMPARPTTRIFVVPKTRETLQPVVSSAILPAGVDPIITGSNAMPAGEAEMVSRLSGLMLPRPQGWLLD